MKKYFFRYYNHFLALALLFAFYCRPGADNNSRIQFIKGGTSIIHQGKVEPGKVGTLLQEGDIVSTAADGIMIISLKNNSARLELQPNARMEIRHDNDQIRELYLASGNAWTQVNKLTSQSRFYLKTPTTVAGVRGTKFYTFKMNDIFGTCFCEGKVEFQAPASGWNQQNDRDYAVFTRDNKTVIITADEMKKAGIKQAGHNHSLLADSPLGGKNLMPPEEFSKYSELVNAKLTEKAKD